MEKYLQRSNISIKQALTVLSQSGNKCLVIIDNEDKFLGTLSDGDLRKKILTGVSLSDSIEGVYQKNCVIIEEGDYDPENAKNIFVKKRLDLIPIIGSNKKVSRVIFWEDLLQHKKRRKRKIKVPVVIMAGGEGTRLEPFTKVLPKPLIPVGGETIIEKIIGNFTSYGIDEFYLSINFKSKLLKAFFEELSPKYKVNFIEEKKPLGTAGSLSLIKKVFQSAFFISNCDILINCDYIDIYKFHKKNKFDLTLVASAKNYVIPYGTCVVSEGKLKSLEEKPSLNLLVNTGLYLLNPDLITLIPKNKFFDITELIEKMLLKGMQVGVYTVDEDSWIDVGQWTEYRKAVEKF